MKCLLSFVFLFSAVTLAQAPNQVRTFVRFEDKKTTIPVNTQLSPDKVQVKENGKLVTSVELTPATDLPIRYLLLFDESGSGRKSPSAHAVRAAVPEFLRNAIRPDKDTVALVDFNDEYYLDSDFTSDLDKFERQLREKEDYRGGTALCDAIIEASNYIGKQARGDPARRVILLFSDGEDNASRYSPQGAISTALRNHVGIYAVSVSGAPNESRGTPILRSLTEMTGGRIFAGFRLSQAAESFSVLKRILDSEYVLTYTSPEPARKGALRKLEIATDSKNTVAIAPNAVAQ